MSNYRVREKTMAYVIQHENFTDEFKSKALLFTDVLATALVQKYLKTPLHSPFKSNVGSLYLNSFNYAAVWSMKTYAAQNRPFDLALEYSLSRNRNTPRILSLKWDYEHLKQNFSEFSDYDKDSFEKDTKDVLNMKIGRYTVKHISREMKIRFEPFWNLEKLGIIKSEEINWNIRVNTISFNTYLGYFFCSNVMTGNLDEISSGI
jgi:hypothetical protein